MRIKNKAFTLLELLITISCIAILVAMLLPALSKAKADGQRILCVNNLKNLGLSLNLYADENEFFYPNRFINTASNRWPQNLIDYYVDVKILHCPTDKLIPANFGAGSNIPSLEAPRSYIFNGFNDYYNYVAVGTRNAFPESAMNEPSETVTFGEKESNSGHYFMDYWAGDDYLELEQNRHRNGSGYSFGDGSVRYLRWGEDLSPKNLWMVSELYRNLGAAL